MDTAEEKNANYFIQVITQTGCKPKIKEKNLDTDINSYTQIGRLYSREQA